MEFRWEKDIVYVTLYDGLVAPLRISDFNLTKNAVFFAISQLNFTKKYEPLYPS